MTKKLNEYYVMHFTHFGSTWQSIEESYIYFEKWCYQNKLLDCIDQFQYTIQYLHVIGDIELDAYGNFRLSDKWVSANTDIRIIYE